MKKQTPKKILTAADKKLNESIDRDIRECDRQIKDIDKALADKSNW